MDGISAIRRTLADLRKEAGLSQGDVADRLKASASRVSRVESGDLQLTTEEARDIAAAIGESLPKAKTFAEYLADEWKIIEKPGFNHVSLPALRKAEAALQELEPVLNDPEIRNAFAQQLKSCRDAILSAACYLSSTEHGIAFVGPPGRGKTSVINTLAEIRDFEQKELDDQMAMKTGGGRVTICEVHVRSGDDYSIIIDPCTYDEIRQFVSDFCDDLKAQPSAESKSKSADASALPSEVERALRNMARLNVKKEKSKDGKYHRGEDPAASLAKELSREDLLVEIMTRLDLSRRIRKSLSYSRGSSLTGFQWLKQTFRDINFGIHPDFSLPRRIEILVPKPILGDHGLSIRMIDTRGNDEPSAPRRDLQDYLDDSRTLIVLCSSFKDAPDAASLAFIERAAEGGFRSPLAHKGLLLVLPQNTEEKTVLDQSIGEPVASEEEGREIRRSEALVKLDRLGADYLELEFLNILKPEDCAAATQALLNLIQQMRKRYEDQIDDLITTVTHLLDDKKGAETKAVLEAATQPIEVWFTNNQELEEVEHDIEERLIREMGELRYASTLRAAVNRRGSWYNFDYWLGLGLGTKQHTVARTAEELTSLNVLIQNALQNPQLIEAHGFLRHFQTQVDTAVSDFYQQIQSLGETVFLEQLRNDNDYWSRCADRWGAGKGYKDDITSWTDDWFSKESRQERYAYIDAEVKRRWREMLAVLRARLSSAEPDATSEAA